MGYSPRGHRESDTTERLSTAQDVYKILDSLYAGELEVT